MHNTEAQETTTLQPLSPGQSRCLQAIRDFMREKGYAPAISEIQTRLGLDSNNSVRDYLTVLEKKGYITRDPGVARSIVLTEAA